MTGGSSLLTLMHFIILVLKACLELSLPKRTHPRVNEVSTHKTVECSTLNFREASHSFMKEDKAIVIVAERTRVCPVIVTKKHGFIRICLDPRKLSEYILRSLHQTPKE